MIIVALASIGVTSLIRSSDALASKIDPDRFQAVVLSSGAIYFGHLRVLDDDFYELRDAFFIQETKDQAGDPARRVLPLSQELHAPDGTILIPRAQVVAIENLQADSPVAKAADTILK